MREFTDGVVTAGTGRLRSDSSAFTIDDLIHSVVELDLPTGPVNALVGVLVSASVVELGVKFDVSASGVRGRILPRPGADPVVAFTPDEYRALELTAELAGVLHRIIGDGDQAAHDWGEMAKHIHGIQHAVMAQLAGRVYPGAFRGLGGWPPKPMTVAPDADRKP